MSAKVWLIIAIIGFSLAGIALVTAIFMFIKMNIPAIIGDLTGRTVAREIKSMRESNISSGDKRFRPSAVNMERGKLTEQVAKSDLSPEDLKKVYSSKHLDKTQGLKRSEKNNRKHDKTIGLEDMITSETPVESIASSVGTESLTVNETEVLSSDTEVLSIGTEVLSDNTTVLGGTTVLFETEELNVEYNKPVEFRVIRSEITVHSDEVI